MALTIIAAGALTIAGLVAASRVNQSPQWWGTLDPLDPRAISQARDLEHAFGNQLTLIRPQAENLAATDSWRSDVWQVAIDAQHANAWLNVNLRKWMASDPDMPQWPDRLLALRVHFDQGRIHVGIALRRDEEQRYLSASVSPHIRPDGSMWLPAHAIHIGTLPIPRGAVLSHAQANADQYIPVSLEDQGRALLRVFQGLEPISLDPVIRLDDGRQVRLLNIEPRNGRLILTCWTELRDDARARRN